MLSNDNLMSFLLVINLINLVLVISDIILDPLKLSSVLSKTKIPFSLEPRLTKPIRAAGGLTFSLYPRLIRLTRAGGTMLFQFPFFIVFSYFRYNS